jgi:hypothetical protein
VTGSKIGLYIKRKILALASKNSCGILGKLNGNKIGQEYSARRLIGSRIKESGTFCN